MPEPEGASADSAPSGGKDLESSAGEEKGAGLDSGEPSTTTTTSSSSCSNSPSSPVSDEAPEQTQLAPADAESKKKERNITGPRSVARQSIPSALYFS